MVKPFLKYMNFNPYTCINSRIKLDLPNQFWEARSFDDPGSLLAKVLHNKAYLIFDNYTRCYTSFFSPETIAMVFTIVSVPLFFAGIYFLISKKVYWPLIVLLLSPMPILFEFPQNTFIRQIPLLLSQSAIMIYGLWHLLKTLKSSWRA